MPAIRRARGSSCDTVSLARSAPLCARSRPVNDARNGATHRRINSLCARWFERRCTRRDRLKPRNVSAAGINFAPNLLVSAGRRRDTARGCDRSQRRSGCERAWRAADSALARTSRALSSRHPPVLHWPGSLLRALVSHVLGSESPVLAFPYAGGMGHPGRREGHYHGHWAVEFVDRSSEGCTASGRMNDERRKSAIRNKSPQRARTALRGP